MASPAFPHSARASWLAGKGARKPKAPAQRLTAEAQEVRELARALAPLLQEASLDQLRQVALILGKTLDWVRLACIEAKTPGAVGKACLKAIR
jgi:predicted 2-oxoglutarate/Fe(II)-dependent dioxygenase YbiX